MPEVEFSDTEGDVPLPNDEPEEEREPVTEPGEPEGEPIESEDIA